ncbi:hypothetical protein RMSM_02919 [Rhodopirellula maiorica SM1]|uniref:Cyclic GMP-AMP synthase n=1 Tax=Rhodopirellula maiorica SM1 TaxID=1265738 RepID=M5RLS6_9BACT|nr:nucleotidyltransferase [Rhodopirellula maiorica]EMI20161.1 hypothetical protein RMSM_02919 [Rhodopirellula maiorica SM1]
MNYKMIDNRTLIVNSILEQIAEELDIPPSKYQQAVDRYQAVGRWLEGGDYPGSTGTPKIYPQGSFRLGTVVRPIREGKECDYDIDLSCELIIPKERTTPQDIRHFIGNRLKEHGKYKKLLDDEGRRCWTLLYAEEDGTGFHLDVLPCVPDPSIFDNVDQQLSLQSAALTDRRESDNGYDWGFTNPAGYADWFAQRQRVVFSRTASLRKDQIFRENPTIYASVDDVPDQLVRTPLQRAIQVLKRHRDIRFADQKNSSDRPISIIINTLAALAYQQEPDAYTTLANFLDRVQRYQETELIRCEDDEWIIANPVNPNENFADRWNDPGSGRPDAFFQWINWLQEDIDEILNASTSFELERSLQGAFGDSVGKRVAGSFSSSLPGRQLPAVSAFGRVAKQLLRFDFAHRQAPKWHVQPTRYTAKVRAKYLRNGFRPTAFRSNAPALPKHVDLVFEAEVDVPKPYTVYWQVVNTGQEAIRANCLRGDFYDSNKAGKTREERTEYSGMHWVECFVVKNDVCVARSGEFVVNIL